MWVLRILTVICIIGGLESAASCTFPTNLASKTWRDSDKGDLALTTDQMTGWEFSYNSASSSIPYDPTWECYSSTTDGLDLILIVRSTATVQYDSSTSYRPFLCMKLRQVTEVSYYYYLQYAEQQPLYYERITILTDSAVSSITDPLQTLCLASTHVSYPSTSEYHMLVENGREALAIQDCPPSLYELYTYTIEDTSANTVDCAGGNSRLDMCSDVKRMAFNYTLCSTTAAYSANGSLFCLVVLSSGSDTLHSVYNEDNSVDDSSTFRFTCFMSSVASDGSVSMSVSPRSCTKTQTPTSQPQLTNGTAVGVTMSLSRIQSILTCDFPCSIPTYLANLNWTDSDKGQLQFSNESMTGWNFYVSGTFVSHTWKCFHTTTVDDDSILILRGSSTVSVLSSIFRPFLCLKLRQITDVSYYYYLLWAEQSQLGYERITIVDDSKENLITDPYYELCVNTSQSAAYPTVNEYHMLIKEGSESSAKQDCPSTFYGVYAYTVEDKSTGTTYCGSNDTQWDVCTDYQRIYVNYTHCSTTVAYSGSGNLLCVFSLTSGNSIVHTVYNKDATVDNTNTFRFTCFISSISSDGNLTVSQTPSSCTKTQTPTDQPSLTNGTVVGLNLQLSPFVNGLCPIVIPTSAASTTNVAIIIGSVLGGLALLGLIIAALVCLYCKVCCCKSKGTAKVATEPNNNNESVKTEKDKAKDKANEEVVNETESKSEVNEGFVHNTKNGFLHGEKHIDDGSNIREKVKPDDTEIDEDLLLTPSSVDITSLLHVRTLSRMETPCGTAPGDTTFREAENTPVHNSFTLPYLQGKSPTQITFTPREQTHARSIPQSPATEPVPTTIGYGNSKIESTNAPDLDTVQTQEVTANGIGDKVDDQTVSHVRVGDITKSNRADSKVGPCVYTSSQTVSGKETMDDIKKVQTERRANELPDNPVIITSHFQEQNAAYMNKFMELPRKETVGPHNDHEFREKRTYSKAFSSGPKADTILSIMSKENGFKPLVSMTSPPNTESSAKSNTETAHSNGDATYLLQRANTFSLQRNKSGLFQISATPEPGISEPALDDTVEGIAYDEDNQKARKHVQFNPEKDMVRELSDYEFEYGAVNAKIPHETKTIKVKEVDNKQFTMKQNNKTTNKPNKPKEAQVEKKADEDNGEGEDGERAGSAESFAIDNSRLKTAMSVLYSEEEEDPDKMTISGYDLLIQ